MPNMNPYIKGNDPFEGDTLLTYAKFLNFHEGTISEMRKVYPDSVTAEHGPHEGLVKDRIIGNVITERGLLDLVIALNNKVKDKIFPFEQPLYPTQHLEQRYIDGFLHALKTHPKIAEIVAKAKERVSDIDGNGWVLENYFADIAKGRAAFSAMSA